MFRARRTILATAVTATFAALAVPFKSNAKPHHPDCQTALERTYCDRYDALKRLAGARAPGRDIVRDGWNDRRPATAREVARSSRTLRRMLGAALSETKGTGTIEQAGPGPVPPAVTGGVRPAASPRASGGGGTGGLPSCADESHGNYSTGPANTNPSGATGRWQEMPVHRQPGGLCYGDDLTPAGQDRCAHKIYQKQGSGAWVGCG